MSSAKEIFITIRCDEEYRDWIGRQSVDLDMSISDVLRKGSFLAVPQMKAIRGLSRVHLEDMRDERKTP